MWFGDALGLQVKLDAEGTLTIKAFGAELTMPVGAAIDWLKTRSKDTRIMRNILSETFIVPKVMWFPLERETPQWVEASLNVLEPALRRWADDFASRRSEADKALGSWLVHWANAAALCAKAVRGGVAGEGDPADTGMDMDARDFYLGPIGQMRLNAYPAVTMLLVALPEADPVRIDAAMHLQAGIEDLRSHANRYKFSPEKLEQLGFFPRQIEKGVSFGLPAGLGL
jgi:hypothetical protein